MLHHSQRTVCKVSSEQFQTLISSMKISYRSIFPATSVKGFSTHLLIQLNVQLWFLVLELFPLLIADSRLWWSQECQTLKHLRIAIIFCVRRLFIKGDWLTCERCNNSISPFSLRYDLVFLKSVWICANDRNDNVTKTCHYSVFLPCFMMTFHLLHLCYGP